MTLHFDLWLPANKEVKKLREGNVFILTVTETGHRENYTLIQKADEKTLQGTALAGVAAGKNITFFIVTNGLKHLCGLLPPRPHFIIQ